MDTANLLRPLRLLLSAIFACGLVLFAVARLYEAVILGSASDPATLPVTTLKAVLDEQGIDHRHLVEKTELVQMVKDLGPSYEEQVRAVQAMEASYKDSDITFTSGDSFYRNVTAVDNAGVWLVLVVTHLHSSPASRHLHTWSGVGQRVTGLGLRTALLNCTKDPRNCEGKGWLSSRVLLVVPREVSSNRRPQKTSVVIHAYSGLLQLQPVLQWVYKNLQEKVVKIQSTRHLDRWLTFDSVKASEPDVRAVYFTQHNSIPTFLSMISIEYQGEVKFAVVREKDNRDRLLNWMEQNQLVPHFPQFLFVTLQGDRYTYGHQTGEYYALSSVRTFLQFFSASATDVLKACFFIGIFICFLVTLAFSFLRGGELGRVQSLIFCNFILAIVGGVVFLGYWFVQGMGFYTFYPSVSLLLATSTWGTALRREFTFYSDHPYLLAFSLVPVGVLTDLATRCFDRGGGAAENEKPSRVDASEGVSGDSADDDAGQRPSSSSVRRRGPMLQRSLRAQRSQRFLSSTIGDDNPFTSDVSSSSGAEQQTDTHFEDSLTVNGGTLGHFQPSNARGDAVRTRLSLNVPDSTYGDQVSVYSATQDTPVIRRIRLPHDNMASGGDANPSLDTPGPTQTHPTDTPFVRLMTEHTRRELMRERRMPMMFIQRDGRLELVPLVFLGHRGVFVDYVDRLDTWEYRPAADVAGFRDGYLECSQCVICMNEFTAGDTLGGLPCKHVFHKSCIQKWLHEGSHTCPVCRKSPFQPNR